MAAVLHFTAVIFKYVDVQSFIVFDWVNALAGKCKERKIWKNVAERKRVLWKNGLETREKFSVQLIPVKPRKPGTMEN